MTNHSTVARRIGPSVRILPALLALLATACAPSLGARAPGDGSATPSLDVIEQVATASGMSGACSASAAGAGQLPGWPMGGSAQPSIIPMLVSSLVSIGPNRLLYNITDSGYRILAAPAVRTFLSVYALERDPETPVATVEGTFLTTPLQRGMYRANVDLDCAGEWGLEVTASLPDGSTVSERLRFQVHASGTTPAVGQAAPRSQSPTASTLEELHLISTDTDPFPGAYERTIGEVVTSGQPSLVFFATPSFCQTGYCGPTVSLVKSVALEYRDRVGFVIVEPYELHLTENGLQPRLDDDGNVIPVQSVLDYGIPVEPYLFLVDAHGDVFAKFEGVVGEDELRGAIEDALGQAQPAHAAAPRTGLTPG